MNITLAIDKKTVEEGRKYARDHHTTLNNLIRQLLQRTVSGNSTGGWVDEFFELADTAQGNSKGNKWAREDLYDV